MIGCSSGVDLKQKLLGTRSKSANGYRVEITFKEDNIVSIDFDGAYMEL